MEKKLEPMKLSDQLAWNRGSLTLAAYPIE